MLVTGGSRGIGRAIARAFAEQGDRVAVHWGGSRERAEQVLAELPGDGHVLVQADMADADAVGAMVDAAAAALGGLDVLVNNAGVFTAHPPLTTSTRSGRPAWAHTLAVNLRRRRERHLPRGAAPDRGRRRRGRQRLQPRRLPRRAEQPRLRRVEGRAQRLRPVDGAGAGPARHLGRPAWRRGSCRPRWPARCSTARAGTPSGRSRPSAGSPGPEEVASAVLWLASPGAARSPAAPIVDVNGASYLRT